MRKAFLAIGLTFATALGCSSNSNDGSASGSAGTAGTSSTTGGVTTSTGGKVGSGGTSSAVSNTNQSTAIGGNTSSAGSTALATGGNSSSAGASSATGGLQATGGSTTMAAGGMSMGGTGMMAMTGGAGTAGSSNTAASGGAKASGGSAAAGGTTGMTSTGGMMSNGGMSAIAGSAGMAAGGSGGTSAGSLTLTIDASLGDMDPDAGTPNTAITAAVLLNKQGTVVATATLSSGSAVFNLTGIAASDYFIEVNGDTTDLVPARIDDPTLSVLERTSPDLSASYIGPVDAPIYRINTYVGDDVLGFSSGATIAGEAAYVVVTLANPQIEFRVLGTGALLSSLTPSPTHSSGDQPFDSWLLNTPNQDHHGDMYNSDPTSCATCHRSIDIKPATYSAIKPSNGWCFRCHNGTGGPPSGIFDSAQ